MDFGSFLRKEGMLEHVDQQAAGSASSPLWRAGSRWRPRSEIVGKPLRFGSLVSQKITKKLGIALRYYAYLKKMRLT